MASGRSGSCPAKHALTTAHFLSRPVSALSTGRSRSEPAGRQARDIHGQSRTVRKKEGVRMTNHKVATREEWQAARDELLAREKS
jgi:hypothetical protein